MPNLLPPRVQAKLATLKDAEQQALTIMTYNQRAIDDADRSLATAPQDRVAVIEREIVRLRALQPDYQAGHRALTDLVAKVARFLALLPANVELEDARPIRAKTKSGETHLQAVQRLRGRIMEVISERGSVERASPTTKEMKAAAKRYVESLALRGTPRLIIEHEKFDMQFGRGTMSDFLPPEAMLAWVDPALLQRRLDEMIDELPKPGRQIDADERKQRLDEIKAELFDLERHECAHIDAARDEGTVISHRPNVDIKALLGLVTSRSKANAA
ncbi:hypothetical protein SAMN05216337_109610 [Bradyrhizobium brasilense]|uniref:Uncharacterized protein n=1 Tax=Bradyrhizobium brasilense TaxID=1419277 RepID=A0A1G7QHF9_9BRAD|nr:hypothetical protein [Bradyrhizobium brasilense]SDF97050.1 hypothetical protein SAMN05216337_109610 [Bradyrhizobium brasilense]